MPRAAPASISGNRRQGPELTQYQRGIIVGERKAGNKPTKIASDLNVLVSTVKWALSVDHIRLDSTTNPRTGQPNELSERQRRTLTHLAR